MIGWIYLCAFSLPERKGKYNILNVLVILSKILLLDLRRGRCSLERCCIDPAALLPYPWGTPLKNTLFCPIPVSDSNFNPRNTPLYVCG